MPTLRRSKSLNDKISRQKNRTGDVIRDPRSPDVEGRTRTCIDNFQALVHLRKQTEDKARQLELAISYATRGSTSISSVSRGPRGGVELPYATTSGSVTTVRNPAHVNYVDSRLPPPAVYRRQRSAEGRREFDRGFGVRRQESLVESQAPLKQAIKEELQGRQKSQRPMSMIEPRGGGLFLTQDELNRKDQVIQNLTESQRSVNLHNQQLLSRIDELEFQNHHLVDILNAHNIPLDISPQSPNCRSPQTTALHNDVVRITNSNCPSKQSSTVVSPNSETSVSGYGSLAGSACEDACGTGGPNGRGVVDMTARVAGLGDYDDDTLPLSRASVCSQEFVDNTLPNSSSDGDSKDHTLSKEKGNSDLNNGNEDQMLELDKHRDTERKRRIEELERELQDLSVQRETLLARYKHSVAQNDRFTRRDEGILEDLTDLLKKHDQSLEQTIQADLQAIQQQLRDLSQDVHHQVDVMLAALTSHGSKNGDLYSMEPHVREVLNLVVDLIGPEYHRLGRQLTLSPSELENIEDAHETFAEKSRMILESWLKRREQETKEDNSGRTPAKDLDLALQVIDKDLRLVSYSPVTGPERQTLKNCLQFAIDRVTDPAKVLDHLIALNEFTPDGIIFVQKVIQQPERALSRIWHLSEYRETGIVSTLALALERSGYSHVSSKLTDELAIQNSRIHSQTHPTTEDAQVSPAAESLGSRPSRSQVRSKPPPSRVPRPRSRTAESTDLPSKPPAVPAKPAPSVQREKPTAFTPQREKPSVLYQAKEKQTASSALQKRAAQSPRRSSPYRSALQTSREKLSAQNHQKDKQTAGTPQAPLSSSNKPPVSSHQTSPSSHQSSGSARQTFLSSHQASMSSQTVALLQRSKQVTSPTHSEKPASLLPQRERQTVLFSHREKQAAAPSQPGCKQKVPSPFGEKQTGPPQPGDKQKMQSPFGEKQAAPPQLVGNQAAPPQLAGNQAAPPQLGEKQAAAPQLGEKQAAPPLQREKQAAIWDRRQTANSCLDTATKNTIILEQGSKISRV